MSSTSFVHVHCYENTIARSLDAKKLEVKKGTRYFALWIIGYEREVEKSDLQKLIKTISKKFKQNIIKLISYDAITICEGYDLVTWANELYFPGEETYELSERQKKLIDSVENLIKQKGFQIAGKENKQEETQQETKEDLYRQIACVVL